MLSLVSLAVAATTALQVPFVPQQKDTCGAAALAMVMAYYGDDVPQAGIASALLEPELHGIRGARLAEFARGHGMVALVFAGDLAFARAHVGKRRPLILALSAGRGRYHDVVLVGLDEASGEAIVNDPDAGPGRRLSTKDLDRRWKATGRWTLLVQPLPPTEPSAAGPAAEADVERPPDAAAASAGTSGAGLPGDDSYDGLVRRAVALGRDGKQADALALLDRAVGLDGARPEARVERGGLHFLEGRYLDAVADLRRALEAREDAYTRDLLASSLQMAGREREALAVWNPLGKPTLGAVEIGGLRQTRDEVARREVGLSAGDVLTPARLRAAGRRLDETGAFDRVTVRPRPRGDGTADLDVALSERHGLGHGPVDLLVSTGVNLAWQRLRLRYWNLGGTGVALGGSLRWQENRPETALQLQWPRPFGVAAYARLAGFRGEQAYDLGQPLLVRRHGIDLGFRHVLDDGVTVSLGVRARDRSFSRPSPDAEPGLLAGLEAAVEGRLLETRRQRLDGTVRVFGASPALASQVQYAQADAELRYEALLSEPEGRSVERSLLAARLRAGWATHGLPLDEMYAPGVSPESDLVLRAHPLAPRGIIGANPVGRSLVLANVEWRRRLVHRSAFDVSAVGFLDAARVGRVAIGSAARTLLDTGVGLRVSILAGPVVRVDQAWGLSDGRRALFVGLSQAF